ncbi:unnamed protein product [Musa banksii]
MAHRICRTNWKWDGIELVACRQHDIVSPRHRFPTSYTIISAKIPVVSSSGLLSCCRTVILCSFFSAYFLWNNLSFVQGMISWCRRLSPLINARIKGQEPPQEDMADA